MDAHTERRVHELQARLDTAPAALRDAALDSAFETLDTTGETYVRALHQAVSAITRYLGTWQHPLVVYYVQIPGDPPRVKIGRTRQLALRLVDLERVYGKLEVLAVESEADGNERRRHQAFAHLCTNEREVFTLNDELRRHIELLGDPETFFRTNPDHLVAAAGWKSLPDIDPDRLRIHPGEDGTDVERLPRDLVEVAIALNLEWEVPISVLSGRLLPLPEGWTPGRFYAALNKLTTSAKKKRDTE